MSAFDKDAGNRVHTAVLMNALPVGNHIRPSELDFVQRRAIPCISHCRMRTSRLPQLDVCVIEGSSGSACAKH